MDLVFGFAHPNVIIIYYWQQRFLWFLIIKFSRHKMNFFTFEINVFWCGPSKWSVESGSIVFEVSWFDHLKFEGRSFLCGSLSRPGRAGHIKKRCLPSLLFTLKKVKSHFETLESYFCNNSETQLWIILIWKRDLLQIWQMWECCRLLNRSRKAGYSQRLMSNLIDFEIECERLIGRLKQELNSENNVYFIETWQRVSYPYRKKNSSTLRE